MPSTYKLNYPSEKRCPAVWSAVSAHRTRRRLNLDFEWVITTPHDWKRQVAGVDGPRISFDLAMPGSGEFGRFWMASGKLPSIRLGRCVRVPAAALHSWIAARTQLSDDMC
jgi:hypothetical protein